MLNHYVEAGETNNIPTINWDLIDVCQYRCSYCYNEELINKEEYKLGLHQSAWKLALRKLKNLKFNFKVAIHGGEPTLHPELYNIVSELEALSHCVSVVVTSNITADDETYLQFDKPGSKVAIHLSYHPEYHRKIFNKIVRITNKIKHIDVWAGAVIHPKVEYYDQMIEFLEAMKDTNIKLHVVAPNKTNHWQEEGDDKYYELFGPYIEKSKTSFTYKHVTDLGNIEYIPEYDLIRNNNGYQGWQCQALSYTIGVDGTIINNCTKQRLPMLIKESDVKKFVTCPQSDLCYCSEMFIYKKYKNVNPT